MNGTMRGLMVWILVLFTAAGMAGCGAVAPTTSDTSGGVNVRIDLAGLAAGAKKVSSAAVEATPAFTSVHLTLSRDGNADIERDMDVANDVATATVTGLAKGYWHVVADVYDDQTLLYTGAADVNIIAGAQVTAEILFDPADAVVDATTTGSLSLSVGFNKFPGYTKIQQFVSVILQDSVNQKFYIFDSSASLIAVYNAETLVREKDILLDAPPLSLAVEPAGGSLLLGYSTGKIYRLNVSDESLTQVADSLISVSSLVPISSKFVLAGNGSGWGPSNTYETINLQTGQISSTKSYWYPLSNFSFNPVNGMVYALDSGLSPADMHHVAIDSSTGTISTITDSRYHGDYYYGAPIRVIKSGTRIVTGSGNMFISSALASEDITYAGNVGHPIVDLVSDDTLGNLYLLNSDNIRKLLVINQSTMFSTMSLDVAADPKQVFNTPNKIVVFVKANSDYYAKAFSKAGLGLM